jgi:hypothetical protein
VSTQIPQAIDKLVALFQAALPAADDLTVADGPQVKFPTRRFAVVGGDGPVDEEEDAAQSTQTWKGLGAMIRDESINVVCAVGSSSGDSAASMRDVREEAADMLQAIEDALRADPGLGGFTTGGAAAVTDVALRYPTNTQGRAAVLVFTINIPVRSGP